MRASNATNHSLIGVLGCALLAWAGCADNGSGDDGGAAGNAAPLAGAGGSTNATAVAQIAPFGAGAVTGSVTFSQSGTDVTAVVALSNCPDGAHAVHIHQGASCADAQAQGDHWDMTRGEGIPEVVCTGGSGMVTHTRSTADPTLAWSIGGNPVTDVVGHVFVVHDPGMPAPRIGCGQILAQ